MLIAGDADRVDRTGVELVRVTISLVGLAECADAVRLEAVKLSRACLSFGAAADLVDRVGGMSER